MQCDICSRTESSKLSFCCTTCARNSLYEPRLKNIQTLLEKEKLDRQVQATTGGPSSRATTGAVVKDRRSGARPDQIAHQWAFEQAVDKSVRLEDRTHEVLGHVDFLRKEIQAGKADITRRRAYLAQRRSQVAAATDGLTERRAVVLESLSKNTRNTEKSWNGMHRDIVNARIFLCTEAAKLYGLRQRRRKRGGSIRDEYTIGGLAIVDLRDLNSKSVTASNRTYFNAVIATPPAQITVSMARLAHLLVLSSHYLSLRLPAEVVLPHKNHPLTTIFSPGASYSSRQQPSRGSTPLHYTTSSPSASRNSDLQSLPRPRPLYLDKKLPVTAKEDPVAYSLFVEGVTLLAWDVAWLCWTQGLQVGTTSWEDICALGKNLWQLLVSLPHTRSNFRALPSNGTATTSMQAKSQDSPSLPERESLPPLSLGDYSHGSARSFLGGPKGTQLMQGWKLQSPVKIIDKVKSMLLGELAGAEWEILDGNEFEQEIGKAADEEAVLVGARREEGGRTFDDTRSMITAMMVGNDEQTPVDNGMGTGGTGKGTSGWTKLKSRGL